MIENMLEGKALPVYGDGKNIRLVNTLCEVVAEEAGKCADDLKSLITYVKDRPGHDQSSKRSARPA